MDSHPYLIVEVLRNGKWLKVAKKDIKPGETYRESMPDATVLPSRIVGKTLAMNSLIQMENNTVFGDRVVMIPAHEVKRPPFGTSRILGGRLPAHHSSLAIGSKVPTRVLRYTRLSSSTLG